MNSNQGVAGNDYATEVSEILAKEMFWNVRLAVAGLVLALMLFYAMVMIDTSISEHIFWLALDLSMLPIISFFLWGEKWVKNTRLRVRIANSLITAAAFTFACHRFTFVLFASGWLFPIIFYFFAFSSEIGGDLSSAQPVMLDNKRCTIFLNADAMGKSIQGAGGALVLGIIFDSILHRTKNRADYRSMSPEKWLKSAFIELQNAFECFKESMLASAILGVVEHETGALYYINLEHPWAVLYRSGRAEFLIPKRQFRKFGTTGMEDSVSIDIL